MTIDSSATASKWLISWAVVKFGDTCVAVPVQDGEGRTVASMSVTERPENMTPARQALLREALLEAAAALGRKAFPKGSTLMERHAMQSQKKEEKNAAASPAK